MRDSHGHGEHEPARLDRAKVAVDEGFDKARQTVHEYTAPKSGKETPKTAASAGSQTQAKSAPKKKTQAKAKATASTRGKSGDKLAWERRRPPASWEEDRGWKMENGTSDNLLSFIFHIRSPGCYSPRRRDGPRGRQGAPRPAFVDPLSLLGIADDFHLLPWKWRFAEGEELAVLREKFLEAPLLFRPQRCGNIATRFDDDRINLRLKLLADGPRSFAGILQNLVHLFLLLLGRGATCGPGCAPYWCATSCWVCSG